MLDMFLFVVINKNTVYITPDGVRGNIISMGYVSSPVAMVTCHGNTLKCFPMFFLGRTGKQVQ